MTPPKHHSIPPSGPKSVQDYDQNGSLGLKDQVEVQNPRNPSGTKSISVDYFISVEYRDPAGRSPIVRLGDVLKQAKTQGFGPKGRFQLEPEVVTFALEHNIWWLRNQIDKR